MVRPGSSLSSRRAPRQTCHSRGANLRSPALQAATLPKELSRQLIPWLFGNSTWPGSCYTARHLHGSPSAYAVYVGCTWTYQGLLPLLGLMTFTQIAPTVKQINHVGVTTIERLDQGHLYPLGEHRDNHVTVGAQTSDPLHHRQLLYLKSYLDSLFAGYSLPLLGLRAAIQPDLYNTLFSTSHSSYDEAGIIWEEPVAYKYCSHHIQYITVMRLGQAGYMHGFGGVFSLQSVAEILWPFSPTGAWTCVPHIRGSNRAVSEW